MPPSSAGPPRLQPQHQQHQQHQTPQFPQDTPDTFSGEWAGAQSASTVPQLSYPGSQAPGPYFDAPPDGPPQPQTLGHTNTRSVDDFGAVSGPLGVVSGGPASGRFATFPVKNARGGAGGVGSTSGSGFSLRDDPVGAGPSFESTVAEAMGGEGGGPGPRYTESGDGGRGGGGYGQGPSGNGYGGVGQTMGSGMPSYEVAHTPMYAPPPGPPPGARMPMVGAWGEGAGGGAGLAVDGGMQGGDRRVSQSSGEMQLAYMEGPGHSPVPLHFSERRGAEGTGGSYEESEGDGHDQEGERHVRFGGVSDVDEEMERREVEAEAVRRSHEGIREDEDGNGYGNGGASFLSCACEMLMDCDRVLQGIRPSVQNPCSRAPTRARPQLTAARRSAASLRPRSTPNQTRNRTNARSTPPRRARLAASSTP